MYKLKYILAILLLINACQKEKETAIKKDSSDKGITKKNDLVKLTNSKINSEGTYLFNSQEDILINWTTWSKDKSKNQLQFAFFDKKTNQFKKPITIPQATGLQLHVESMAKVGITKKGFLYAVYRRKNPKSKSRFGGFVYYCISKDNGQTWSDERKLVSDKTSKSQAFFDIALLPNGEIGATWLDSRKPIDKNHIGKTVYFASTNLDNGFVNSKPIAGSTCECCRTNIFVDTQNNIYVAYRNLTDKTEPNFDDIGEVEIRDMYYTFSNDMGENFSKPEPISQDNWHINGCPHTGPSLANKGNQLSAVWFTGKKNEEGIYYAFKEGEKFNTKTLLSNQGHHPQMIALFGKNYVVYEEYYEIDEKGYTKIVLEEIGNLLTKKKIEVSKPKTNNNHAVLTAIDNQHLVIAWVNDDTRNPKIMCKIVSTS